jgi:hypothetical protein
MVFYHVIITDFSATVGAKNTKTSRKGGAPASSQTYSAPKTRAAALAAILLRSGVGRCGFPYRDTTIFLFLCTGVSNIELQTVRERERCAGLFDDPNVLSSDDIECAAAELG